jgi:hypothetical protein
MLVLSVSNGFALAKVQHDTLATLYPGIGAIVIQESSTGFGFVGKTSCPRDEFKAIELSVIAESQEEALLLLDDFLSDICVITSMENETIRDIKLTVKSLDDSECESDD